jgi:5-methylcytosine-specific restriction protein A
VPLVRGCRNRWCPEYAGPDGWCDAHRKPPFRSSAPMPPGWPQIRAAQLAAFPWCAECGATATDVHHVTSRAAGGTDDPSNLRSMCGPCHHRLTGREWGGSWA